MRRRLPSISLLFLILIFPSLVMAQISQSVVVLDQVEILDETDLGIEGVVISPDGESVIAYGSDSSIFIIDPNAPKNYSRVEAFGSISLLDASFHPGGRTVLLVGQGGAALRIVVANHSVESAGGASIFGETDLTAISWNSDGSWAYVGGEEGWIWKYRGLDDGRVEAAPLDNRGTSDISSISCLRESNVCIVLTAFDGIGIINQEHELSWIGGFNHPWVDVECKSISSFECVAVSSDLAIARINVNTVDPSETMIHDNDIVQLLGIQGVMTGIYPHWEGNSLISMAPFGLIEYNSDEGKALHWLDNSEVVDFDVLISGERVVGTWATGYFEGWVVTDKGSVVSFGPIVSESSGSILEIWVGVIILGGTALMILSLVSSSSPRFSRWITKRIGSEEEKKSAIREERRISRKRGRA